MLNLILAVINTMCGVYFILTLEPDAPGFIFVLLITIIINIIGLSGLILWFWSTLEDKKDSWSKNTLKSWKHLALGIDLLLIVGFIFRIFVIQPFLVDGNSMDPSFKDKEFILVDRVSYRFKDPQRGNVIVFRFPKDESQDYIKRIIGLPGDTVTIDDGRVYINGQLLTETYLTIGENTYISSEMKATYQKRVSANEYFVMGDNRTHSSDSRDWGLVPRENIIGRAWLAIYPIEDFGLIEHPKYNIISNSNLKSVVIGYLHHLKAT